MIMDHVSEILPKLAKGLNIENFSHKIQPLTEDWPFIDWNKYKLYFIMNELIIII